MAEIQIPFPFGDLPLKPELTGKVKISTDVTQTLATLLGWDGSGRRLLRSSNSGVLQVVSPQARGVVRVHSTGISSVIIPDSQPSTEVIVLTHPDNGDRVYINIGVTPTANNGFPLGANESIIICVENLNRIQTFFVAAADQVVLLYTR